MQSVELFPWWLAVAVIIASAFFIVKGFEKSIPVLTMLGGFFLMLVGFALPITAEPSVTDVLVYLLNTPTSLVFVALGVLLVFSGALQLAGGD